MGSLNEVLCGARRGLFKALALALVAFHSLSMLSDSVFGCFSRSEVAWSRETCNEIRTMLDFAVGVDSHGCGIVSGRWVDSSVTSNYHARL
jgi:hypothetical protein